MTVSFLPEYNVGTSFREQFRSCKSLHDISEHLGSMHGKVVERFNILVPQEHHNVSILSLFCPENDPEADTPFPPRMACHPEAQQSCIVEYEVRGLPNDSYLIHGCEARTTPVVTSERYSP